MGEGARSLGHTDVEWTTSWQRSQQEEDMARKFIDCRQVPSDVKCSVAISADTTDEVLDAAVLHAVNVHKQQDSPELRQELRGMIKDGSPS